MNSPVQTNDSQVVAQKVTCSVTGLCYTSLSQSHMPGVEAVYEIL
jgi:hypothetical protein